MNGSKAYKYILSWTTKDGAGVENQLFTAEHISHKLAELESAECTSIKLESCDIIDKGESSHEQKKNLL